MEQLKLQEKVKIVMKQTDYTHDKAMEKLKEFDGNMEKVILEYVGGSNIKEKELTTNQMFFKAIRDNFS